MIDYTDAHVFSSNHRRTLGKDEICGCFYCLRIFPPNEIKEWVNDPGETAIWPYCVIDSVIGKSSGYPITMEILEKMQKHWF